MTPEALLRRCVTAEGFLAAVPDVANYRRVWARDGVICGVAALLTDEAALLEAFAATLHTLATHRGPAGQIPSNVDGQARRSLGTRVGRVDATTWWLVGAGLYDRLVEPGWLTARWPVVVDACAVLRAWEYNDGGLIWTPEAGNWADEYPIGGYTLYDNLMRLWAAEEVERAMVRHGMPRPSSHRSANDIRRVIGESFQEGVAAWGPGGEHRVFDGFATALWALLDLPGGARRLAAVPAALVAAFSPPILPGDARWPRLVALANHGMRNLPGEYHNGGRWPMITGFMALAARRRGDDLRADAWLEAISAANRELPCFSEFHVAEGGPAGTALQAWSAAGEIMARATPEQTRRLVP